MLLQRPKGILTELVRNTGKTTQRELRKMAKEAFHKKAICAEVKEQEPITLPDIVIEEWNTSL